MKIYAFKEGEMADPYPFKKDGWGRRIADEDMLVLAMSDNERLKSGAILTKSDLAAVGYYNMASSIDNLVNKYSKKKLLNLAIIMKISCSSKLTKKQIVMRILGIE